MTLVFVCFGLLYYYKVKNLPENSVVVTIGLRFFEKLGRLLS